MVAGAAAGVGSLAASVLADFFRLVVLGAGASVCSVPAVVEVLLVVVSGAWAALDFLPLLLLVAVVSEVAVFELDVSSDLAVLELSAPSDFLRE